MSNIDKYNKVFIDVFNIDVKDLDNLSYGDIIAWNSVGHMTLISALEDAFDVLIETDDIISFKSYINGIEILSKEKYGIKF